MIIAAYAGTEKSTFAARFPNAADVVSMPRSWILPPIAPEGEIELEKGKLDRLRDPLYPKNYIIDILRAEREYDYVLIPTKKNPNSIPIGNEFGFFAVIENIYFLGNWL